LRLGEKPKTQHNSS